jgi:phosphoglycerate dehydrogenase-like enzyme
MRIAILDDYQNAAMASADWSSIPDAEVTTFTDHLDDIETLAERLRGFDVIVAMRERTPFPRALLERLDVLRLLITTGARNATFDMAAAKERGITVAGTRGTSSPTAELAWGLIIALARHIPAEDAATRSAQWQTTLGIGLEGRTLGVVGLGNLGGRVARVGNAFGMDVIAWSQNLTAERAAECGAMLVAKDELLSRADFVSIHLQLSDRTRGLIGERELAVMRRDAYLVNTSRGPIVEEAALIAALESSQIAGAGLDVFDREPLPLDHPLRHARNVVLTPHLGYVTKETYDIFYGDAVEDIRAWAAGSPVRVIE